MIYGYRCFHCEKDFDVVKSHHESDKDEVCPKCGEFGVRDFAPKKIHLMNTKVTHAEFNPGLGCVVNNKKHMSELCKIKGVEPIGNEKPESIHKHYDKAREEKADKAYEDATHGWIGDGTGD